LISFQLNLATSRFNYTFPYIQQIRKTYFVAVDLTGLP
jgi:hypothetical protein